MAMVRFGGESDRKRRIQTETRAERGSAYRDYQSVFLAWTLSGTKKMASAVCMLEQ